MTHLWCLEYIPTFQNNNEVSVWQLTGKPMTGEEIPHQNLVNTIRSLTVMVGVDELKADGKVRLECVWCKSEMHQSHACLFSNITPTWQGPTKEEMNSMPAAMTSLDIGEDNSNGMQKGYRCSGRGRRKANFMTCRGFKVIRGKGCK